MKIENAIITSTKLGYENNLILTFSLGLTGDGWGVGFGGYALDEYSNFLKERLPTATGFEAVSRVLRVVGVDTWEQLKGKHIRVETNGFGGRVTKIGNVIENKWFDIEEFFNNVDSDGGKNGKM